MMSERLKKLIIVLFLTISYTATAKSLRGTLHDLSVSGGRGTCAYCHTPHSQMSNTPIWNHALSTSVYKIYQSSSLDAKVGQPTGSSKLCLSCHDGTVALAQTPKGRSKGKNFIPPGSANIGTDLSDDHPISFVYSSSLSTADLQIHQPSSLPKELKLDRSKELQCTTCHDPHDNTNGDFLVMTNRRSSLCISCHKLYGWVDSSHENSAAPVQGTKDSYLRKTGFSDVADNGCLSCHRPHSAGGPERLLHFLRMEDNCLNCHDGSVAKTNIERDLTKVSRHDVIRYEGIHDQEESPATARKHVECVDCHNPHATIAEISTQAPVIKGTMRYISGITISGSFIDYAQYEFEVCFKCHGDNPDREMSKISRLITQTNTRLEFEPSSPSFHPVVSPGVNQDVPSLIEPLTVSSMIYCTDCHNSDSASGTKGPHGSNYSYLLAYRYETADFTQETEMAYELCYKCHSRNSILNDESFPKHRLHIEDEAPCSACHDAHGISSVQGNSTNNTNLINFDINIVKANASNLLEFKDDGIFKGECSLQCHNREHDAENY